MIGNKFRRETKLPPPLVYLHAFILSGNNTAFGEIKVSKDTVRLWKKKYLRNLMTQYKYGQFLPSISWRGAQVESFFSLSFN